jgi:hypothetical protein
VATSNKDFTERSENEEYFEVPMDCEEDPESTALSKPTRKGRGKEQNDHNGTGVEMENETSGSLVKTEPESMAKHKLVGQRRRSKRKGTKGISSADKRAKRTPRAPKPLHLTWAEFK